MSRFCGWLLAAIVLAGLTGCGPTASLGKAPQQKRSESEHYSARSAKDISASVTDMAEREVVVALQKLGASFDVDESGHVRIAELVKSQAADDDLQLLARLPHLESLDITGGKITPAALAHLKELKGLQRLYLTELQLTDESLRSLAGLTELDVLSLRKTPIADEGLAHLNDLKRLRVLNLANTLVTNRGLESLQSLTELDTLVLADTRATGEGFAALQPLKKLRVLNMDRCRSLATYLMDLSGLTELRMLYTHGCTVPEEEIEELTNVNPRLAVFGD